ncbi:MAG: enolase C-terminal domain-like protein, partial [Pseudomonadota bacterium]
AARHRRRLAPAADPADLAEIGHRVVASAERDGRRGKIGGIGGWREAAAMARGAAIPVSSHLYIEASAHVLAVTPGAYRLEYLDAAGALLTERFTLKNGGATPRGPGLGIDWDEDAVARALV